MSLYERDYGTDWTSLDVDEALERAYALGVAASFGEHDAAELEAIRGEMTTAYERSVVDLAFDEGKTAGLEADPDQDAEDAAWEGLLEGDLVTVDPEDVPTGGRQGLPEAVDRIEAIERVDIDSTERTDLPEFLQRD